jgi:hypothetical protein
LVTGIAFGFCLVALVRAGSSTSSNLFDPPGAKANTLPGGIVVDVSGLFLLLLVFLKPLLFFLETFSTSYK